MQETELPPGNTQKLMNIIIISGIINKIIYIPSLMGRWLGLWTHISEIAVQIKSSSTILSPATCHSVLLKWITENLEKISFILLPFPLTYFEIVVIFYNRDNTSALI